VVLRGIFIFPRHESLGANPSPQLPVGGTTAADNNNQPTNP